MQIITAGEIDISNTQTGALLYTGFYNSTTKKFATFPLIDVPSNATTPFYEDWAGQGFEKQDGPGVRLLVNDTSYEYWNFTDYVMFQATNGNIWVPEGTFSWVVDAISELTKPANIFKSSTGTIQAGLTEKLAINHTKAGERLGRPLGQLHGDQSAPAGPLSEGVAASGLIPRSRRRVASPARRRLTSQLVDTRIAALKLINLSCF